MTQTPLRIEPPLSKLRKALKVAGAELPKELTKANKAAAAFIADEARSNYRALYTQHSGKSAKTIRPFASATRAQVGLGSPKQPHLQGQEFGGGRRKRTRQFPPWRGNKDDAGYFFWPAVRDKEFELKKLYAELIEKVTRKAFPEKGKR